ncbi:MAG: thioredoxin fold domain-containing protein [Halieaceae bacterium]|nr:thioredoxin fold domain-containing protein [Halieaceae bacterium]
MRATMFITKSIASIIVTLLALGGCSSEAPNTPAPVAAAKAVPLTTEPAAIAWFEGDIEAAFATAKKQNKPLFLYWGAEWCPYCKELEANIFIRDEFVRLSRQFVPLDMSNGDSETIRYADEYKIYGLPTVIVFNPQGDELTRMPGGIDMAQYVAVLELTLNQIRPVAKLVAAALAGESLSDSDWQLLANYSWGQDRGQALGEDKPTDVLMQLRDAAPASDTLLRSRLALAAMEVWLSQEEEARDPSLASVHVAAIEQILADSTLAQANLMKLSGYGQSIVELAQGEQQLALQENLSKLCKSAVENAEANLLNRASVLSGWAEVATVLLAEGESPAPDQVVWGKRQADALVVQLDTYQLHAGVNSLWGVYFDLGLIADAKQTLQLGIDRSKAPFYFMSGMGYVELDADNNEQALAWYRKAWEATRLPLDRTRWGRGYVRRLLNLAPDDLLEVERAGSLLLADMASQKGGLNAYAKPIAQLDESLEEWSADSPKRQAVAVSLRARMTDPG